MKVLLTDDDLGTLNSLKIRLVAFGCDVVAVDSGRACLEKIDASLGESEPY